VINPANIISRIKAVAAIFLIGFFIRISAPDRITTKITVDYIENKAMIAG
jgi:hypothetical protein